MEQIPCIYIYSQILNHNTSNAYVILQNKIPLFLYHNRMIKPNGHSVFRQIKLNLGKSVLFLLNK